MEYFNFEDATVDDYSSTSESAVYDFQSTNTPGNMTIASQEQSHGLDPKTMNKSRPAVQQNQSPLSDAIKEVAKETPRFHVPAVSCDNCWISRLHCLIINGGIGGCSSCKALSHACSFDTENANDASQGKIQNYLRWTAPRVRKGHNGRFRRSRESSSAPRSSRLKLAVVQDIETAYDLVQNMNPMERWKNSPPHTEPTSISAIANAIANLPLPSQTIPDCVNIEKQSEGSISSAASSFSFLRPSSVINSARSSASDLSQKSTYSSYSSRSLQTLENMERRVNSRRRRRRRSVSPPTNTTRAQSQAVAGVKPRRFQCTFCTAAFLTKFDWRRHEKTQHLSLEMWICSRFGPVVIKNTPSYAITITNGRTMHDNGPFTPSDTSCVYCNQPSPTTAHLTSVHSASLCCNLDTSNGLNTEGTFYRKDHLQQHLRLVHNCTFQPDMELWKSELFHMVSRCGFCNANFTKWEDRVDHVGRHFRGGALMQDWKGSWGFESYLHAMVENITRVELSCEVEKEFTLDLVSVVSRSELKKRVEDRLDEGVFGFEEGVWNG